MIPASKGSPTNQIAQPSTRYVNCSVDDAAVQWCKCPKTGFSRPVLPECNYWFPPHGGTTSSRVGAAAGIALAIIEVIDALGTHLVAKLPSLASALR
ncbi:hypothetical protein [Bradyrhizobium sp. Gha]|uniref:hypothetical protein n=1 Tax=Bradyrhizobium sp. Gha TaxID=1855318 RepID=UPI001FCDAE42|nr:hypothetical protein [Bradyrhizobium sp. Gha]